MDRPSGSAWMVIFTYSDDTNTIFTAKASNNTWTDYVIESDSSKTIVKLSFTYANNGDDVWNWKELSLTEGDGAAYTPYQISGIDAQARPLETTGDETDRTDDIIARLSMFGCCELGKGVFYTTGIEMPDSTCIKGQGNATKLMLIPGISGSVITLGSRCNVSNLTIAGDLQDIAIDGDVDGTPTLAEETSIENLWADGNISIPGDTGFVHLALTKPIPAGVYKLSALVSKDDLTQCYIGFSRSQAEGSIPYSSIFAEALISPNERETICVYLPETVYSVRLCSSTKVSTSSGITAEWTNINITEFSQRNGITWKNASGYPCAIHNCVIEHFNGAGLLLQDTMTPVDKGLYVSDCWIRNNNAGIFIRKDSEFNKFTNCAITKNYYGYYNRGGNNCISNCGIDANVVNVRIDDLEGSNGGHGSITGCSLNHADNNSGYSLIISGTGRMTISNCNIYFGKTLLENTNGNIISGCGFGRSTPWEIKGGSCSMFIGCIVYGWDDSHSPVTITDNTAVKIINCYSRAGNAYI